MELNRIKEVLDEKGIKQTKELIKPHKTDE